MMKMQIYITSWIGCESMENRNGDGEGNKRKSVVFLCFRDYMSQCNTSKRTTTLYKI